jgi:hypothetical protein
MAAHDEVTDCDIIPTQADPASLRAIKRLIAEDDARRANSKRPNRVHRLTSQVMPSPLKESGSEPETKKKRKPGSDPNPEIGVRARNQEKAKIGL